VPAPVSRQRLYDLEPRPRSLPGVAICITGACGEESDTATIIASESRGRVTVTPIVAVASPQACWTALVTSSLFTELTDGFPQFRGHVGGSGVRDFYLRAG